MILPLIRQLCCFFPMQSQIYPNLSIKFNQRGSKSGVKSKFCHFSVKIKTLLTFSTKNKKNQPAEKQREKDSNISLAQSP